MELTEVRVTLRDEPRLKAFVNVTFDDDFVVRGMKVIEGKKGLFVAMPSRKGRDGVFRDIAHPINNNMRKKLERIVLEKYYKKCEEEGRKPRSSKIEQEDFEAPEDNINIENKGSKEEASNYQADIQGSNAEGF
ncbi:MAG: septation regulator SpoVG [candidate division WOR-3 bacterium]